MQQDDVVIVKAKRPQLDAENNPKPGKYDERQFTGTQWEAMGKDKGGWQVAAPSEAAKIDSNAETPDPAKTAAEAALLNARERYETLFGRKPHQSKKIETLEGEISTELARLNAGGSERTEGNGGLADAENRNLGNGPLPPAGDNKGAADAGDASGKAAADDAGKKAVEVAS